LHSIRGLGIDLEFERAKASCFGGAPYVVLVGIDSRHPHGLARRVPYPDLVSDHYPDLDEYGDQDDYHR
jgi:hypothetical protein